MPWTLQSGDPARVFRVVRLHRCCISINGLLDHETLVRHMPFAKSMESNSTTRSADFTRPWEGEAETLVLLHGLHGHLLWWHWYQVAFFAQHYRVVTVDQRGHGRSFKPATGYSSR